MGPTSITTKCDTTLQLIWIGNGQNNCLQVSKLLRLEVTDKCGTVNSHPLITAILCLFMSVRTLCLGKWFTRWNGLERFCWHAARWLLTLMDHIIDIFVLCLLIWGDGVKLQFYKLTISFQGVILYLLIVRGNVFSKIEVSTTFFLYLSNKVLSFYIFYCSFIYVSEDHREFSVRWISLSLSLVIVSCGITPPCN